jgi:hypothetical protein
MERTMTNQLHIPPSLFSILDDVAELGSRIGALGSLGAGFAAALRVGTIDHDAVAILLDGYGSSLVALQKKIAADLGDHLDAAAEVDTSVRGHHGAGERMPVQLTRSTEGTGSTKAAEAA